jgi:hypothetical protein
MILFKLVIKDEAVERDDNFFIILVLRVNDPSEKNCAKPFNLKNLNLTYTNLGWDGAPL